MVTQSGMPSGMAATARVTDTRIMYSHAWQNKSSDLPGLVGMACNSRDCNLPARGSTVRIGGVFAVSNPTDDEDADLILLGKRKLEEGAARTPQMP